MKKKLLLLLISLYSFNTIAQVEVSQDTTIRPSKTTTVRPIVKDNNLFLVPKTGNIIEVPSQIKSFSQFITYTNSSAIYDGSIWVKTTGSSNTTATSGYGAVVTQSVGGFYYQRLINGNINVKWFGAKGDGTTNDELAIQAAFNTYPKGNIYFPKGVYIINSTITITANHSITGDGIDITVIRNQNTNFAFEYNSPLATTNGTVVYTGAIISNFTLYSKNGIKYNQSGNFASIFNKQDFLMKMSVKNIKFIGTNSSTNDVNALTATKITNLATIEAFGVGLRLSKVFESKVENCIFQEIGIGTYLDGADLTTIENCRYEANNSIHSYILGHDTFGARTRHVHNFYSFNLRYGGVRIETVHATNFEDCYFENYLLSACYIQTINDYGTTIINNTIDDSGQATNLFDFAPTYGLQVKNNRCNPGNGPKNVSVTAGSFWTGSTPILGEWIGNQAEFPVPTNAGIRIKNYNPQLFSGQNYSNLDGAASSTFPWNTDNTIQTTTATLITNLTVPNDITKIYLKVTGVASSSSSSGFMNVNWGGQAVFSNFVGITSTTAIQSVFIPISKSSSSSNQDIQVEFVNTLVKLTSIEVISTPIINASTIQLSGNGSTTSFTIAHGLGSIPNYISVEAGSTDAKNIAYKTVDATNITVVYTTAPPSGTNNLTFYWSAKK